MAAKPSGRPHARTQATPQIAPPPDTELLRRFSSGDPAAFAVLVRRHQSQLYGYLCRCGVSPSGRDDLFQEIFLRVNQAAARFDSERPFKPWLFAIAVNCVRSHFRKARRVDIESRDCELEADGPTGEQVVAARETARWMNDAIATLPVGQRDVLLLVCIERMSPADVASVLEIPRSTVKTLLRRGRLALAKKLASRNARIAREHRIVGSL